MLVTHMPMKLKGKNSDGRLQDEKTIRQVVVQLDYKKKKERDVKKCCRFVAIFHNNVES